MKTTVKIAILLSILFVVQLFAQTDPGWILSRPSNLNVTLNSNSFKWDYMWLINHSPVDQVTIMGVTSSQPWLSLQLPPTPMIMNPHDSILVPVIFDASGYSEMQILHGQVTIYNDGPDPAKIINVTMNVTANPPNGPIISVLPNNLNLTLEKNLTGELKLQVSNSGDVPLHVFYCTNHTSLIYPMSDSALNITPLAPAVLTFQLNTQGFMDYQMVYDTIVIMTNPTMFRVPVTATILPDTLTGDNRYGDVNWDGQCNMLDVNYMVGYFKGLNIQPCMPAADMNGNGVFNGIDVAYLVSYMKGIGNAPVNQCSTAASNYAAHLPNRQIQIGYLKGHRGEWVTSPVVIETQQYYTMQGSMSLPAGLIDSARAINVSGDPRMLPNVVAFDTLRPGYKSLILQEEDYGSTRGPAPLTGPTHLYDLQLYIPASAPAGSFPITPDQVADRGSSKLTPDYGDSLEAPMFYGSFLTIAPRAGIDHLAGFGDLIFVEGSTSLLPSITISSDGDAMGDVYIVIRDSITQSIVYTDTVRSVAFVLGLNPVTFGQPWVITQARTYLASAGAIINNDDYLFDNFIDKKVNTTSYITVGLPPTEGFEEPLVASFPPVGWMVINQGGPNTWERTGLKARSGVRSSAVLTQSGEDQSEWFVKGPIDWTSVENPSIIFYEAQDYWTVYGYRHEFYVSVGDTFNADDAVLIDYHTPANHMILSYFSDDSVEFSLSSYGFADKVWFAFRYYKNPSQYTSDSWYIDDITWVDRHLIPSEYEYIMGDANFAFLFNQQDGHPVFSGADVTYAVRYLKALSDGCFYSKQITPESIFTLYAMMDVNGDCKAIGSDITRMVRYFKGIITIDSLRPCSLFTPNLTPVEEHYPPCIIPPISAKIIPSKGSVNNAKQGEAIIRREQH